MTAERKTSNGGIMAKLTAEERKLMKKLLADDEALAEAEDAGEIEEVEEDEEVEPGETITIGGKKYRVIEVPDEVEEEIETPAPKKVVKKAAPVKKAAVKRVVKEKVIAEEDEEIEDESEVDPEPEPVRKRKYLT